MTVTRLAAMQHARVISEKLNGWGVGQELFLLYFPPVGEILDAAESPKLSVRCVAKHQMKYGKDLHARGRALSRSNLISQGSAPTEAPVVRN